jgi:hypothetical protein
LRLLLLCALALTLLAVTAGAVAKTNAGAATRYRDLPTTRHAAEAHAGQRWNADSIASFMDAGGCQPTKYACPADDFEVSWCQVNDDKAIGLVIGRTTRIIVTGFMASADYWRARC